MADRAASTKGQTIQNKDGHTLGTSFDNSLPGGRCNYTVLGVGGGRCGCLRFWDRRIQRSNSERVDDGPGWCVCEHHACFHERAERPPSSHRSLRISSKSSTNNSFGHASLRKPVLNVSDDYCRPAVAEARTQPHMDDDSQSTYRMLDDDYSDAFQNDISMQAKTSLVLGPCEKSFVLPTSAPALLASGVEIGSSIVPNQGLGQEGVQELSQQGLEAAHTLGLLQTNTQLVNRVQTAATHVDSNESQFPDAQYAGLEPRLALLQTEVTRMVDTLHPNDEDLVDSRITDAMDVGEPPDVIMSRAPFRQVIIQLSNILKHIPLLTNAADNHARRIDLLENASYSNIAIDELRGETETLGECHRDLESKVEELTRSLAVLNDNGSVVTVVNNHSDDNLDATGTSYNADMLEFANRLDALEQQLTDFRSTTSPSHADPWEVEVIYIPFGLRGIWYNMHDFPTQRSRTTSASSWTRPVDFESAVVYTPGRSSSVADSIHGLSDVSHWQELAEDDDENLEWLMPRAFQSGTKIEERLRSRGFIHKVTIPGSSARDVHITIMKSFGEVLDMMSTYDDFQDHSYHGLRAPWIPLRKEHKNSRLRLLETSEMITPALWTVPFLSSSAVMKSTGLRRLFITHRDAYLQSDSCCNAWTWQRLRELPKVYNMVGRASVDGSKDSEKDSEHYWEHDSRLDPPIIASSASAGSSFGSQASVLSMRSVARHPSQERSNSPPSITGIVPGVSSTDAAQLKFAISDKNQLPDTRMSRTKSTPILSTILGTPTKRKLHQSYSTSDAASTYPTFVPAPDSSPVPEILKTNSKRRRTSHSTRRNQHSRNTPRWSYASSSSSSSSPIEKSSPISSVRGTTPFAYATPHSNVVTSSGNWHYRDLDRNDDSDGDSLIAEDDEGLSIEDIRDFVFDDDSDIDAMAFPDHLHSSSHHGIRGAERKGRRREGVVDEDEPLSSSDPEDRALDNDDDDDDDEEEDHHESSVHSIDSVPSEYTSTQPVSRLYFGLNSSVVGQERFEDMGEPVPR